MKHDPPPSKATMTAFQYKIDLSIVFCLFFFLISHFFPFIHKHICKLYIIKFKKMLKLRYTEHLSGMNCIIRKNKINRISCT